MQEWVAVRAGALLPDALHGSAERVVVARAGLAHQPEHDRLGLGLGHAAGTHRDGSSRPSVALLASSSAHESVARAKKGTLRQQGYICSGQTDQDPARPA